MLHQPYPKRQKLDVPAVPGIMASLVKHRMGKPFQGYDYMSFYERHRHEEKTHEIENLVGIMADLGAKAPTGPGRKIAATTAGYLMLAERLSELGLDINNRHLVHCAREKHAVSIHECTMNSRPRGKGNNMIFHVCVERMLPGLIDIAIMKLRAADVEDFATRNGRRLVDLLVKEFYPLAEVSRHVQAKDSVGLIAGYLYAHPLWLHEFPLDHIRKSSVPAWQLNAILGLVDSDAMVAVSVPQCDTRDPCFGGRHNGDVECLHRSSILVNNTVTRTGLLEEIETQGLNSLSFVNSAESFYQHQIGCVEYMLIQHSSRVKKLLTKVGEVIEKKMK